MLLELNTANYKGAASIRISRFINKYFLNSYSVRIDDSFDIIQEYKVNYRRLLRFLEEVSVIYRSYAASMDYCVILY